MILVKLSAMSSAYGGKPGDGKTGADILKYLPLKFTLKDGTEAEIDFFQSEGEVIRKRLLILSIAL